MVINTSDRYNIITLIKKKNTFIKFQKQPFVDAFQKRFSSKFRKIHRKTNVLELFFNKIARLEAYDHIERILRHRCFMYSILRNF